jgi:antitoxin PrlF
MAKKCCGGSEAGSGSSDGFQIESVVSIDDRGQMVLPKSVRQALSIGSGDRLALAISRRKGKACCIYLFKVEELAASAQKVVSPLSDVLSGGGANE